MISKKLDSDLRVLHLIQSSADLRPRKEEQDRGFLYAAFLILFWFASASALGITILLIAARIVPVVLR